MARQEEGWPLGLQPLNLRVALGGRARDYFGSISFNTMLTGSSTSSDSSDLDTESTGSFFHDRSITLGSLIGVSSILELSRRSLRGGGRRAEALKPKKPCKSRPWIFSLCSRHSTDVKNPNNNNKNPPSLGHFLAVERRAATTTTQNPNAFVVTHEISMNSMQNSLFVNGQIAPPPHLQSGSRGLDQGIPVLLSCMCGHAAAH